MLHLSADLAETYVEHCFGARINGCLQMLHLSADLAYTHVKQCSDPSTNGVSANAALVSGFGVHSCENTALANVPTERLQMLHLSADLAHTQMKHCVGTSANEASTNAAPVSEFGVHSHDTLPWRKYQWSVCKICKCNCHRIWRTLT